MADEEGIKCYLESSKNVPNVQIYERMGFEMSKEMECRDGDDVCMVCSSLSWEWLLLMISSYIAWCGIPRRRQSRHNLTPKQRPDQSFTTSFL